VPGFFLPNGLIRCLSTGRAADSWTSHALRLVLPSALAFLALGLDRQYLLDFWHHLARGRAMVEQGRLVDHDLFTFTVRGQPFQDVNWLTQLLYYGIYQAGGLPLVQTLNALAVALTLFLLVRFCCRVSGSAEAASAWGVFTFLGLWQILALRPQTLSLLLFVLLYEVLDRAEQDRRWLVWPPLLLALWSNLHGAFPAGLLLLGCFLLDAYWRAWRQPGDGSLRGQAVALTLCLAGCCLATLLNPYGWKIYRYVGQTSQRAAARAILEWLPPQPQQLVGACFFLSLGLLGGLLLATWRRPEQRLRLREWLGIGLFVPLAAGAVRMVAWWLLFVAPLASRRLAALLPTRETGRQRGAGLALAGLLLLALLAAPLAERFSPLSGFRPRPRPLETALARVQHYLATHAPTGRLFSRFEWGEYLSWAGAPRFSVFLDGRIEIYPDAVWQDYLALRAAQPGWQEVLERYGVDYLVLDAQDEGQAPLRQAVAASPAWQFLLDAGEGVLLYGKRLPAGAGAAPRASFADVRQ
jgi:hypothetical protein